MNINVVNVKIMHDPDVHQEVETGFRLWKLRPIQLWKDWSEGASEDIAVGRRCYSETVQEKDPKSEGGQSRC